MADFQKAYEKTAKYEGGYSNSKADRGGETYAGISRKNFPNWVGWSFLDTKKTKKTNHKFFELDTQVQAFYRAEFWDKIKGDDIVDQSVANNVYDFSVNSGVNRASRYTQQIIGVTQDGVIGNKTVAELNLYDPVKFVTKLKAMREEFLRGIVAKDETQKVFLAGWIDRTKTV